MLSPGHDQICTVELNFKLQTKLLEWNSLKQSFDLLPNELSRIRDTPRHGRKEDLMILRKFPFLLRLTKLNGEIDASKTRLHLNIMMKTLTSLFDGSRLTLVRILDLLPNVASVADGWKCFVIFALWALILRDELISHWLGWFSLTNKHHPFDFKRTSRNSAYAMLTRCILIWDKNSKTKTLAKERRSLN